MAERERDREKEDAGRIVATTAAIQRRGGSLFGLEERLVVADQSPSPAGGPPAAGALQAFFVTPHG